MRLLVVLLDQGHFKVFTCLASLATHISAKNLFNIIKVINSYYILPYKFLEIIKLYGLPSDV